MRKVEVVMHNPGWKEAFQVEAEKLQQALGNNAIAIHHIGSTAIPGIYAKPIIDLLIEVVQIDRVNECTEATIALGYDSMGEFGIAGRRYFRKNNGEGVHTHHVHVFSLTSPEVKRHLRFRDYLIAHPETAQEYSQLKRQLAAQYPTSIEDYMNGKHELIQRIDRQAAQWDKPQS